MPWPYFIWKGTDCQDKDIVVTDYPPVTRPKERVSQVTVPGRQGTLLIPEVDDEPMYEAYLKTVTCCLLPDADIGQVMAWLSGAGTVIFGNEPEMIYTARIINQISFDKILRGNPHRRFSVPFYVQPLKAKASSGTETTLNSSGTQIVNPGDVIAHPRFAVYGSGDCSFTVEGRSETCNLSFGNNSILVIDSDAMICTNISGANRCSCMTSDYPLLNPGVNTITWEGSITKIIITGRWRWL